ncbi:MAG: DinB family protein, partial [Actinomycetota bacterium]
LIFAESAWALRTAFNEKDPFHELGFAPDHALDEAIDVGLKMNFDATYEEVVDAMLEQHARVTQRFEELTDEELRQWCTSRGKGYPGDYDGMVAGALHTYLTHEWDHHRIIERVMADL